MKTHAHIAKTFQARNNMTQPLRAHANAAPEQVLGGSTHKVHPFNDAMAKSHTGGAKRRDWAFKARNAARYGVRTLTVEEYLRTR